MLLFLLVVRVLAIVIMRVIVIVFVSVLVTVIGRARCSEFGVRCSCTLLLVLFVVGVLCSLLFMLCYCYWSLFFGAVIARRYCFCCVCVIAVLAHSWLLGVFSVRVRVFVRASVSWSLLLFVFVAPVRVLCAVLLLCVPGLCYCFLLCVRDRCSCPFVVIGRVLCACSCYCSCSCDCACVLVLLFVRASCSCSCSVRCVICYCSCCC